MWLMLGVRGYQSPRAVSGGQPRPGLGVAATVPRFVDAHRRMKNSHCGWAVRELNRLTDGRAVPVRTGSAKPHNIDAEGA